MAQVGLVVGGHVVRVDQPVPVLLGAADFVRAIAQLLQPFVDVAEPVGIDVPFPDEGAAALQRAADHLDVAGTRRWLAGSGVVQQQRRDGYTHRLQPVRPAFAIGGARAGSSTCRRAAPGATARSCSAAAAAGPRAASPRAPSPGVADDLPARSSRRPAAARSSAAASQAARQRAQQHLQRVARVAAVHMVEQRLVRQRMPVGGGVAAGLGRHGARTGAQCAACSVSPALSR